MYTYSAIERAVRNPLKKHLSGKPTYQAPASKRDKFYRVALGIDQSNMTFTEVYERLIVKWPARISISDSFTTDGGLMFPTLSRVSDELEGQIDHRKDTWDSLMAWTMFQVFHAEAIRLRETSFEVLSPKTVDRKIIEEKYYQNLHGPDWIAELAEYRRF